MATLIVPHVIIMVMISLPMVQCNPITATTKHDGLIVNITYPDTLVTREQMFCFNKHSDRFVFSATTESNGCQIKCIFWASSSSSHGKFYDTVDTVQYNVSDKQPCGGRSDGKSSNESKKFYCRSGVCIDPDNLKGQAVLTLLDGYFPEQDWFSETDAYIKVHLCVDQQYINLGATHVVEDKEMPTFNVTFTSPPTVKTAYFTLNAYDRDSSPDDWIASFLIKSDSCPPNQICQSNDGRNYLNYMVKWINLEI